MFQQINLYQPIFRDEQKLFSASAIGIGLGLVVLGLGAIAAVSWWRVSLLDRQMNELEAQIRERQKLLARADTVFDSGENPAAMEARLRDLAGELDRRQQALRYLRSGGAGQRTGFADRIEALARQQLDGLWLKGATFTSSPGDFALTGSALSAELVPIYLAKLAGEPAFAGTKLQIFEISQPKKPQRPDHPEIDFSLSSSAALATRDSDDKNGAAAQESHQESNQESHQDSYAANIGAAQTAGTP
jgi:hypothetical protein